MTKLFTKKSDEELRSVSYRIHLTKAEAETIRHSAMIRNLSVADFIRRTALGRKADVRYETQIVLELRNLTDEVKTLCAVFVKDGKFPPEEIWKPIIDGAVEAMLRISK